jgi:hypothetical protein
MYSDLTLEIELWRPNFGDPEFWKRRIAAIDLESRHRISNLIKR